MTTLEKLIEKSKNRFTAKMPPIKDISKLLDSKGIKHSMYEKTNTVEYRSKGNRYVNSRHRGKSGYCLTIKEPFYLELDTSDSYYSRNTYYYATKLLEIINN
jgi:hypothetical protein